MPRHYLDHASTSPLRPEVRAAMDPWLGAVADPSRVYAEGRETRAAIENAREQVAALFGARSREVIFTSGATEAINTATFGAVERDEARTHVVVPAVEHSAVRDSSARHPHTVVGVDSAGTVNVAELEAAIRDDTALVHCQLGNHEVATLQPLEEVATISQARGLLLHVDAAQAAGRVTIDFGSMNADLLSVSSHKLGGPAGIGALLIRRGLRLPALLVGGAQERARRAGMESVAAIVGFGATAELLSDEARFQTENERAADQTNRIITATSKIDGVVHYGHAENRLPHIVCLGVSGVEAEAVLLGLDQRGIAVHSGSACSSESLEPSPILEAMGVDAERSVRVSVGWSSTDDDVEAFCAELPGVIDRLRALGRSA